MCDVRALALAHFLRWFPTWFQMTIAINIISHGLKLPGFMNLAIYRWNDAFFSTATEAWITPRRKGTSCFPFDHSFFFVKSASVRGKEAQRIKNKVIIFPRYKHNRQFKMHTNQVARMVKTSNAHRIERYKSVWSFGTQENANVQVNYRWMLD